MLLTVPSSSATAILRLRAHAPLDPDTGSILLEGLLPWLTGLAPSGVSEFVPKSDRTVQRMLALREDIFTDYDQGAFRTCLANNARIVGEEVVSQHGRRLFWYDRH